MSETARNKNRGPQINFEVTQEIKNQFTGSVKGKGLNARDLLERFVIAYLANDPAAVAIASGKSASEPSTKDGIPTAVAPDAHAGLVFYGKSTRMESPLPFTERILSSLNSVPAPLQPAVEDCVTQIVKLALGKFTGVTTDDEQGAVNQPRQFKRLKKLQDNADDVEDVSGKSA